YVQETFVLNQGSNYFHLSKFPTETCGLCTEVTGEMKQVLNDLHLPEETFGIRNVNRMILGYDFNVQHIYLVLQSDEGLLAVDPTAGQFAGEYRGRIYVGPLKEYERLITDAIDRRFNPEYIDNYPQLRKEFLDEFGRRRGA